jgi:hypothetical protein
VEGATPRERAANLAGMLAEAGVTRLRLRTAQGESELRARECDLPGLLVQVGSATILADTPPLRIEVRPDSIEWSA